MRRMLFGTCVALALSAVSLTAAPRTTETATIALNVPTTQLGAFNSSGEGTVLYPTLGDAVTFAVTYPKTAERYGPRVQVLCYQEGKIVYGEAGPYYQAFLLGGAGSEWLYNTPTMPANCVADLYYWSYQGGQKFNFLATVSFNAGGRL